VIKIITTLLVLTIAFVFVEHNSVINTLIVANFTYIFFAVIIQVFLFLLNTFRWMFLLNFDGFFTKFSKLFKVVLLSNFANTFLPSSIGGDALRAAYIYKKNYKSISISSIIFERIVGLMVMLLIGIVSLNFIQINNIFFNSTIYTLNIVIFALIMLLYLIKKISITRILRLFKIDIDSHKWIGFVFEIVSKIHFYIKNFKISLQVVLLTIASQFIGVLIYWIIGQSINIEAPIIVYFVVMSVSLIASAIPISFGGLGVRELTSVSVFIALGLEKNQAINIALIYLLVIVISSFPGIFYYFLYGKKLDK